MQQGTRADTPPDLEGRVAVVTGGGSGIGRALAAGLSDKGALVAVADIDISAAEETVDRICSSGHRAIAVGTDVTSLEQVEHLARVCESQLGPVSLLCSNAGVLAFGQLQDVKSADWRWISSVNVEGLLNCVAAFGPGLRAAEGWRHILVTASTHGFIDGGGTSALYSASKHALVCIAESLRAEMEADGVGVTTLCPGPTRTRILDSQRHRPQRYGPPAREPFGNGPIPGAAEPDLVASLAIAGIMDNDRYVFAGDDMTIYRSQVEDRWRNIDRHIASASTSIRDVSTG